MIKVNETDSVNENQNRDFPSSGSQATPELNAAPSLELQAERLIGDLEYGCAANFTEYRGAALAIGRAYLRTASSGNGCFSRDGDERIRSAAIRKAGVVYPCFAHTYHEITRLNLDAPEDVMKGEDSEQGFVTTRGRFVSRFEALEIARRAEQIIHEHAPVHGLFSEDLRDTQATKSSEASHSPNDAVAGSLRQESKFSCTEAVAREIAEKIVNDIAYLEDMAAHDEKSTIEVIAAKITTIIFPYLAESETGWLIEKMSDGNVHYITADQMLTWTDDPNKALRLKRREDAEMLCSIVEDADKIAEHEWVPERDRSALPEDKKSPSPFEFQ